MQDTVFVELQFWLLVLISFVVPGVIVWACLTVREVSRNTVLVLGVLLVIIAGFDFYLLQTLARMAKLTPSLAGGAIFDSEITVGLYVLPAFLAGIGINVVSPVLIQQLTDAEERFGLAWRMSDDSVAQAIRVSLKGCISWI
ncbi:MAG: hypothetical protein ABI135_04930 [Rhodoferax sp.]